MSIFSWSITRACIWSLMSSKLANLKKMEALCHCQCSFFWRMNTNILLTLILILTLIEVVMIVFFFFLWGRGVWLVGLHVKGIECAYVKVRFSFTVRKWDLFQPSAWKYVHSSSRERTVQIEGEIFNSGVNALQKSSQLLWGGLLWILQRTYTYASSQNINY